jgi:hypothetical protein
MRRDETTKTRRETARGQDRRNKENYQELFFSTFTLFYSNRDHLPADLNEGYTYDLYSE